MKYKLTISGN